MKRHKTKLLEGRVLAIDPSSGALDRKSGTSSNAGWAVFEAGQFHSSGIIQIDGIAPKERLESLAQTLNNEFDEEFDILVIEDIWGYMAAKSLVHAVGLFAGLVRADAMVEINVQTWKSIATRLGGWHKDDATDATYIGIGAMVTAMGFYHKKFKKDDKARIAAIDNCARQMDCWGITEIRRHVDERSTEDS